jgi:hypothetical protein
MIAVIILAWIILLSIAIPIAVGLIGLVFGIFINIFCIPLYIREYATPKLIKLKNYFFS